MDRPNSRRVCRYLGFLSLILAFVAMSTTLDATQIVGSVLSAPEQAPPAPDVPGQPPRDRVPARRTGTAVIRGRVFDAATGTATTLSREQVRSDMLSMLSLRHNQGAPAVALGKVINGKVSEWAQLNAMRA